MLLCGECDKRSLVIICSIHPSHSLPFHSDVLYLSSLSIGECFFQCSLSYAQLANKCFGSLPSLSLSLSVGSRGVFRPRESFLSALASSSQRRVLCHSAAQLFRELFPWEWRITPHFRTNYPNKHSKSLKVPPLNGYGTMKRNWRVRGWSGLVRYACIFFAAATVYKKRAN